MTIGEVVEVQVGALAPGGDAAARQRGGEHDGRVVFVPLAAPGDVAHVRIERERRRVAFGELVTVERPSPVRALPPCPLFGRCGGCQWQHVGGEAQRQAKGAIAARALRGSLPEGSAEAVTTEPAAAVGPEYGYRDRARFTVGEGGTVGFRARRSHAVVDVPACPLLSPAAAAALPAVRAQFRDAAPGTQIALQAGSDGRAAVSVAGRVFLLEGEGPAAALVERDPGDPAFWPDVAEPGGRPLTIPPGAFAQVGQHANAALVAAVDRALGPAPGRVLELHAGSGNFTRLLVARSSAVTATDGEARALERGRRNVPEARWLPATSPEAGTAAVDTVLVDPPREGLDPTSLALAANAGRAVVYVSCDPQTLGRDVVRLGQRGWRLQSALAFDLMPQTHHVEVVALLVRAS